ncbi:MAG: phosphopantothenoylcysteine decarboxylase [Phycisphaeraceae bacterium]|nr:phosphopantothenoylcysteine decarboxylase [Phycisphaeraceae bacterium]
MASRETASATSASGGFEGRTILVGVTGGIACYKVATLVSRLAQRGAQVRVLMTEAATKFVGPLTFQALSGGHVATSIWEAEDRPDAQHIAYARSAGLMIIAPATADILAKIAAGICDDVVSLVACALPQTTPLLLAPAMNQQMWENPITQRNIQTLRELRGCHQVGPESGWQACRTSGAGRMSEPEAILAAAEKLLGIAG